MKQAYISLFAHGEADKLPPLEQLAVYYKYQELTPLDSTGDKIIDSLADRLIAMDLLREASELLTQRMKFRYAREARSRIGLKLAQVLLMLHQPKEALDAIQNSAYGNNPETLQLERTLTTAQILAEMRQYADATAMLNELDSPEAKRQQLEIYWLQKNWPAMIETAENYLKAIHNPALPLSEDNQKTLLKLAIAYQMEGEDTQLSYLHDYFSPKMQKTAYAPIFRQLTLTWPSASPTNFAGLIEKLNQTELFLADYEIAPGMRVSVAHNDNTPTQETSVTAN